LRHYLSFGGGVNSVALHILMLREGYDFEAVFVHHGTDWPETYDYLAGFQNWLKWNGYRPIKIINASVSRKDGRQWASLVDHCEQQKIIPQQWPRWCTVEWKRKQFIRYAQRPAFVHIGIDAGEAKRAKISSDGGFEQRYLLVEHGIDREGCKQIIRDAGIPVPMKSGCYICPYQRVSQWKQLRRIHPCLFQRAVELEKVSGRTYIRGKTLPVIVNEDQMVLFEIDEYPPCQCGL